MRFVAFVFMSVMFYLTPSYAEESMYCEAHAAFIHLGMTEPEVLKACGTPISKKELDDPVYEKVPITQLIYTSLNRDAVYQGFDPVYSMWSINSGSTGTSVEIDIFNEKVRDFRINGNSTNAMSLCHDGSIAIGDDISQVYNACGDPSMVNETFIKQAIPSQTKPQIWFYQPDKYKPPFHLTFIDGLLQSID